MGPIDASGFAKEIIEACASVPEISDLEVTIQDNLIARVRVHLAQQGFIDVFYNVDTQRTAFSWINGDRRVLGVDNTGGWHLHPIEDPETHRPIQAARFGDFLQMVRRHLDEFPGT